jgi:hypothetical protein
MEVTGITEDDIAAEIARYLEAEYPDYAAQGYAKTADIAAQMGLPTEIARKRLLRAVQDGKMEMLLDRSRQAWWRKKLADS